MRRHWQQRDNMARAAYDTAVAAYKDVLGGRRSVTRARQCATAIQLRWQRIRQRTAEDGTKATSQGMRTHSGKTCPIPFHQTLVPTRSHLPPLSPCDPATYPIPTMIRCEDEGHVRWRRRGEDPVGGGWMTAGARKDGRKGKVSEDLRVVSEMLGGEEEVTWRPKEC